MERQRHLGARRRNLPRWLLLLAALWAFLATLACGGVAGGLLAERLLARYRHTITVTVLLIPLMWLGIAALARDLPTVAVFAVVSSFCTAVWGVATAALRQRAVPTEP